MLDIVQVEIIENIISNSVDFDLDDIIKCICFEIGGELKYDVLIHRFFKEEKNNGIFPEGWFCHLQVYKYDEKEEDYYKDDDMSIKVFGCETPKKAVIKSLKMYLGSEIN